jgi:hypothetical protein
MYLGLKRRKNKNSKTQCIDIEIYIKKTEIRNNFRRFLVYIPQMYIPFGSNNQQFQLDWVA